MVTPGVSQTRLVPNQTAPYSFAVSRCGGVSVARPWMNLTLRIRAPSNAKSEVVFPNLASGKPLQFTQNQYIEADSLEVGRGYFVKYGATVDRTIAGTQIMWISSLVG